MRRIVCPFCYTRINAFGLWFQCSGQETGITDACKPTSDPAREKLTGFGDHMLRAFAPPRWQRVRRARTADCTKCGGTTGRRACPVCHMPLPANFGAASSPFIAMVGAKGTGKTVYLTVLASEMLSTLANRFQADVRLTGDSQGGYRTPSHWAQDTVHKVLRTGNLFEGTARALNGRQEPLVFEWRTHANRFGIDTYPTTFLSFCDTAGDDLLTLQDAQNLRYLSSADAMILLLDPFTLPEAKARLGLPESAIIAEGETIDVLNRITESLRASQGVRTGRRIKIPVAVAFAKMDEFFDDPNVEQVRRLSPTVQPWYDEQTGQLVHENVRALLESWHGGEIHRHLRLHYQTFRYFFVSALGGRPDYEARTFQGTVTPYRVDEPLTWLLTRFRVIPRRGSR